ncbi:MAG: ABC transporter ATP-binding protein [Sarcina sp.]
MEICSLKNVKKVYSNKKYTNVVLKNINLEIKKGEFLGVLGPSGSGKTTLLNIIGCLDNVTQGQVYINNMDITNMKDKALSKLRGSYIGFIVQDYALIKEYTVYENVILPLSYSGISKSVQKEKAQNILNKLGILEKIDSYPEELSGGQCQRVAIARALISDPEIILADEPTGALDQKTGIEIINILKQLNDEGKTIVIITHDINIAKECKKTIKIIDGELVI